MKRAVKNRILEAPVLGYLIQIALNTLRSPTYQSHLQTNLRNLTRDISSISTTLSDLSANDSVDKQKLTSLVESRDALQQQLILMERNLSSLKSAPAKSRSSSVNKDELFADDHILDVFYTKFEDRFRGSEKVIKSRLKDYLPDFKKSVVDFRKFPVLDIGSGRGEFLELLKENDINSQGIDINIDMVKRCNDKGIKAIQGDAVEYLQKSKPRAHGAITGFHIVEHIPFAVLLRLFAAAHKSLAENGFVLFETPNPENIIVASCGFYMDPSHLNPLPPDLLAFALETVGFINVEIRRIHPVEKYEGANMPREYVSRFYGPRDYAVIGYK